MHDPRYYMVSLNDMEELKLTEKIMMEPYFIQDKIKEMPNQGLYRREDTSDLKIYARPTIPFSLECESEGKTKE